jgi:hypothetical protein
MLSSNQHGVQAFAEALRPASDELAAQVDQYLAAGGKIDTQCQSAPRTPGPKQPPTFHRPAVKTETELQVSRIKEMAATMSRRDICAKEGIGASEKLTERSAISLRNSAIKFAIARLEVSPPVVTDVTRSSTRPEVGSNTLIINDPSGLTVQRQESGRKPHSIMCLSSSVEII